jgi:type I restriction enzyme S subunit
VAILDFEACFPDSVVGFVPHGVERDYLYYLFLAMHAELLAEAPVNTQGNLNVERIGAMPVVRAPAQEQLRIVRHIETYMAGFNDAVDHARQQARLLREYRTRLIADAVTDRVTRETLARTLTTYRMTISTTI